MKKIIWTQISKLLIFYFGVGIGKTTLKSMFQQMFSAEESGINEETHCGICYHVRINSIVLMCGHSFCYYCIIKHRENSETCPM
jgi:hypothetical protein